MRFIVPGIRFRVVRFIVPGMSFRVRVRVRGLVLGPMYGPWGQCALRGALGPDDKYLRFIVPGIRFRVVRFIVPVRINLSPTQA